VIVDEKYRGKGLGRKILQELERQSRENNAKLITLTSNPARVPAHRLYESEGFEKRDTGFYQKKM
jgi:ribosomal protein S18 acetylase RimI-like enzyme